MAMDSHRSWSSMELDCLVEIFRRLDLEGLTLVIPFVCKSWLAATMQPLCWKKLDFRRLDLLPWSKFSKSFACRYSLPHFSFTYLLRFALNQGGNSVTNIRFPLRFTYFEDLIMASNECRNLKSVAFPVLTQAVEVLLPNLVCNWKNLKSLELESKPSNFRELVKNISLNCKNFSSFRISGSSLKEDDALVIIEYLPKLKKLELINSHLPKQYLMILLDRCKMLESLNAIGCTGFEADDEVVNSMISHIKDFKMVGCKLYYEYDCRSEIGSSNFWISGYIA